MNCLFIDHYECDYGAAMLLQGVAAIFDGVDVFPPKLSYCGEVHNYARPWCGEPTGTTGPLPWFTPLPKPRDDFDEPSVRKLLQHGYYDLCIVASARHVAMETFAALADDIRRAEIPVLLHDGEDYDALNVEAWKQIRPHFYLKREWRKSNPFTVTDAGTVILPCPFSAPETLMGSVNMNPEYTVAALFGASWEPRKTLCDALKDLPGTFVAFGGYPNHETGAHELKPHTDYLNTLRNARFGVSMRGWGWDTVRHWEIAVNTGLLRDELDIHIPNDFTHNETCYEYRCPEDAARFVKHLSKGILHGADAVRYKGIHWAREYHTCSARVKWILERVFA